MFSQQGLCLKSYFLLLSLFQKVPSLSVIASFEEVFLKTMEKVAFQQVSCQLILLHLMKWT